jgi:hypothetical protein
MLSRAACRTYPCILQCSRISSTPKHYSLQNPPLNLDPGLQALLRDVDISLKNSKAGLPKHKELEIITGVDSSRVHGLSLTEWSSMEINAELGEVERESRKSPAANFGSTQIGSVVLPQELRSAIEAIVSGNFISPSPSRINQITLFQQARSHYCAVTPKGSFYLLRRRVVRRVGGMHIMTRSTGRETKPPAMPSEMGPLLLQSLCLPTILQLQRCFTTLD